MLKMTILVENQLSTRAVAGMQPRTGLSILLDDGADRILFDTGPDETYIHNAFLMNEPLSNLSAVVLSHGHYDHSGGIKYLSPHTPLICHPEAVQERYACMKVPGKTIALKRLSSPFKLSGLNAQLCRESRAIGRRFIWAGEIPAEKPSSYGVTELSSGTPDFVSDEGALVWRSSRGLVIITGCGHRGLENTVRHCINVTNEERVYAIIGGFHLRSASPLKLYKLKKFLRKIKPEIVMGCHCTGRWGRLWLRDKYHLSCGDTVFFEE